MTAATSTRVRWSSTAVCPRKAVYEADGAPARDLTDRERRILFRGTRIGRDYGDWLEHQHGPGTVLREVEIEWAGGVGHADLFIRPERTLVEVLSSRHASDQMRQVKLLQLAGYMQAFPDADRGALVVLDPGDFTEDVTIVVRDSHAYQELAGQVRDRVDAIRGWQHTGEAPGRVCARPQEAHGRFCRHADHCFTGWEDDTPAISDPDAAALVREFAEAKRAEQQARSAVKIAEETRKALEPRLEQVLDSPGRAAVAGFLLERRFTRRQPTLDLKKARLAGLLPPGLEEEMQVQGCMKAGAAYTTWTVKQADAPVGIDFGDEVPF